MFAHFIRNVVLTVLFVTTLVASVVAKPLSGFPYHEIESWQGVGMVFVVRDAHGHIMAHAKGKLEKWKSESQSVWVVRDSHGKFMTFAHGKLETWADGTVRLVLRNKEGKFVAIGKAYYFNGQSREASEAALAEIIASLN